MYAADGFAVATPYIFADGADEYVRFREAVFGARDIGRCTAPDGRIANCQLQSPRPPSWGAKLRRSSPASRAALYFCVADADAAMMQAEQAGAKKMMMDAADMPYGDRQGGVPDSSGNIWWVS